MKKLLLLPMLFAIIFACGAPASPPSPPAPLARGSFTRPLPAGTATGDLLTWSGTAWAGAQPSGGGTVMAFSNTDNTLSQASTANDGNETVAAKFVIAKTMVLTGVRGVQFSGSAKTPQCGVWDDALSLLGSGTGSSTASGTAVTVSFSPVTLVATPPSTGGTAGKIYYAGCYFGGYGPYYAFSTSIPHTPSLQYANEVWFMAGCWSGAASFSAPNGGCSTGFFYSVDPVFQ